MLAGEEEPSVEGPQLLGDRGAEDEPGVTDRQQGFA
jgi:hypothetical protein